MIINKKERTCGIVDFAVPVNHRVKTKESEKKDAFRPCQRSKLWNMKVTVIRIVISTLETVPKSLERGMEDSGIIQNTEQYPGGLKRLAVTQTPVKDHQLMPV